MPLDSRTLDWYYACADEICRKNLTPSEYQKFKKDALRTPWSKLDKKEYSGIQRTIASILKNTKFTVLEGEFIVWAEMSRLA